MRINLIVVGALALSLSGHAAAGGFSNAGVPTRIDLERANGVMIYGAFGNPAGCSSKDKFYLTKDHPQYDKAYAMILTAYASKKKLTFYSSTCAPVMWYSTDTVTYNILTGAAALSISD